MIVLVTGSRYARPEQHERIIRAGLLWATGAKGGRPGAHELWNGGAAGVDEICHILAHDPFGWERQMFKADWSTCDFSWVDPIGKASRCDPCDPYHRKFRKNMVTEYCPTAGFRRNQLMVDKLVAHEGRKVVVGYPIKGLPSRGTLDCLTRALHANLPVISIPLPGKEG